MPKKGSKNKITIESLARMTARGFESVATKDEMRNGFKVLADTLELVRSDIRDLKISAEVDLKDLKHRVERLEKKIGLAV